MNINKKSLPEFKTTDILSKHDVVFRAPVCDPLYGLPIGNGSMGCLLHLSEEKLHININHTDLVDDIGKGYFNEIREDETHTVVRNGAEFSIDFGCPVFSGIYQDNFESRISLKDATSKIKAETPFLKTKVDAFVSETEKCAIVSLELTSEEEMLLRADLKRWGSRSFMYWHLRYSPDITIGLSKTEAKAVDDLVLVSQKLNGCTFAVAVLPDTEKNCEIKVVGKHKAEIEFGREKVKNVDFYISVGIGKTREEAEKEAISNVNSAKEKGREVVYKEHKKAWEFFWNKSYVALSKEDDFIENLWYLNLYYGNSEMKGKFPPHFCNGIWGSYHDFIPWNLYFHYNTQHTFNSYNSANHPELMDVYCNFRRGQLNIAKKYAKQFKGTRGAFYSDISDVMGRMVGVDHELSCNCTCGSQIAMLLYKNYLYTGDKKYFEEVALPVMKEVGEFYLDMLKIGEDGLYHIYSTTAYEGSDSFDDCVTDLVMIRVLFSALIKELGEEAAPFKDRLSKLVDFNPVTIDDDEEENGKFVFGIGKGKEYKGNKVLSVGMDKDGNRVRKTFGTQEKLHNSYYGFPDIEMAPIFPSGLVGIKDKGSELYNMIYNSICMHHPALMSSDEEIGYEGMCMDWCMMPIYLARMGMAEELHENLRRSISSWIVFPQGFCYDGSYTERVKADDVSIKRKIYKLAGDLKDEVIKFNYDAVKDNSEYYANMRLWDFRHFNIETLSIISTGINEMLLQSYDGNIRLFPAVRKFDELSFKLAATGGFLVSAVYKNGEFTALIESIRGEDLKVIFDNVEGDITFVDYDTKAEIKAEIKDGAYTIKTKPGMKIMATSKKGENLQISVSAEQNNDVKILGEARLGEEKRAY